MTEYEYKVLPAPRLEDACRLLNTAGGGGWILVCHSKEYGMIFMRALSQGTKDAVRRLQEVAKAAGTGQAAEAIRIAETCITHEDAHRMAEACDRQDREVARKELEELGILHADANGTAVLPPLPPGLQNLKTDSSAFMMRLPDGSPMSKRACGVLEQLNIDTVGQLLELTKYKLERARNCGARTMDELTAVKTYAMQLLTGAVQ